jgi:hypothetical protein
MCRCGSSELPESQQGQPVGGRGDASTRKGDEEGRRQADPESPDDQRLGIGCVDAPHVERAGKAGRSQQDQEEPEVRGLQRPGSAAEQARGACPETDPPDRHDEGHEQAEGDHGHHRLTRLICPDPGDERGDLDDQLAVSEHRRAGKFPGLGQAG